MCSIGRSGLWQTIANILKAIATVLILKVILGFIDVSSDVINGTIMVSGEYKLGLYFASSTREDYDLLPDTTVCELFASQIQPCLATPPTNN